MGSEQFKTLVKLSNKLDESLDKTLIKADFESPTKLEAQEEVMTEEDTVDELGPIEEENIK